MYELYVNPKRILRVFSVNSSFYPPCFLILQDCARNKFFRQLKGNQKNKKT